MNKNTIITLAVTGALLVGFGSGYLLRGNQVPENYHMMQGGMMMGNNGMGMGGAMNEMMAELEGKTGDAFDQAFLSEMIMHHEGAVAMAQAALTNAKHQEIQTMAQAIISAQTIEINQMKEWQRSWYNQ